MLNNKNIMDTMEILKFAYLALDCFHSVRVKTLLAFATELFEINLKRNLPFTEVYVYPRLPVLK